MDGNNRVRWRLDRIKVRFLYVRVCLSETHHFIVIDVGNKMIDMQKNVIQLKPVSTQCSTERL